MKEKIRVIEFIIIKAVLDKKDLLFHTFQYSFSLKKMEISSIGNKIIGFLIGLIAGLITDLLLFRVLEVIGRQDLLTSLSYILIPIVITLIGTFHKEIIESFNSLSNIR